VTPSEFGPIGDSAIIGLTTSSQRFALGTLASLNPGVRLIALNAFQTAWYVKFGDGTVTVSATDGMRAVPASQDAPLVLPVPSGATHVAILAEGATGDAQISYGGLLVGDYSPLGASSTIAITQTDQRFALAALGASGPAIRLVSKNPSITSLRVKLGGAGVTGSLATSMKAQPGSVENPLVIPVTAAETHLSIFCDGVGGDVVLTSGSLVIAGTTAAPVAGGGIDITGSTISTTIKRRSIADISGGGTMIASDRAKTVSVASGTGTMAFTAAATLGDGWWAIIKNSGTGDVTLDPNGSETIDGLTSWILYPGGSILVQCDGAAFNSVLLSAMQKVFNASGTFTKPGVGTFADIEAWGGGGSGGRGAADTGGGGGGGYNKRRIPLSSVGATETVTIGAGGTAQAANADGATGGNTTFGALLTAYGGGGGDNAGNGGGGGGGLLSAGTIPTAAGGGLPGTPFFFNSALSVQSQGGDAAVGQAGIETGGGGGDGANAGGASVFGGGGGAGCNATTAAAGGASVAGGAGGASAVNGANATAGAQPGGGGGASEGVATGVSGAGGAGRVIVRVW
jgi:hypothetical protein